MRIRLADEDRQRLGLDDEWIVFSLDRLMQVEAEALDDAGYDPEDFLEDLRGYPVLRDGQPVMVPLLDDSGEPAVDDDGQPKLVEKRRRRPRSTRAMVWLALRRAGVTVPLVDLDFDRGGIEYAQDEDGTPEGKDDEAPASES